LALEDLLPQSEGNRILDEYILNEQVFITDLFFAVCITILPATKQVTVNCSGTL
jgi:hypothetical protein